MKNKIIMLISLMSVAAFIVSCSDDDDNGTDPSGNGDDKSYVNSEINTYVYNEYDLNFADDPVEGTEHQDSLVYEQETEKDSRTAQEYKVYTNAEGSYEEDGSVFYSGDSGKLYVHQSFFQSLTGNIEAEGFSLANLFDDASDWFLIADANAEQNKPWEIFNQTVKVDLPGFGEVDADVVINVQNEGFDSVSSPDGDVYSSEKYGMTIAISANVGVPIAIDVSGNFWAATEIGLVKSNIETFNLPVVGTEIAGTERILVSYEK
ncbi:MAG: hypothetical protein ACE364_04520 [Chlorobiota bacterium]